MPISAATLAELNAGRIACATLAECLAVDHAALMRALITNLPAEASTSLDTLASLGITRRMAAAASLLLAHVEAGALQELTAHPSDTVRGWAAFAVSALPDIDLAERLAQMRVFADDVHFGVREWAWLAVRAHVAADIAEAIGVLEPWTAEASANLRRFAVEVTRPRGVWAAHIGSLKRDPDIGLPLLEPLKADPAVYVQDSVANWINDASKSRPDWARALCARWRVEDASPYTRRICERAMRSLEP